MIENATIYIFWIKNAHFYQFLIIFFEIFRFFGLFMTFFIFLEIFMIFSDLPVIFWTFLTYPVISKKFYGKISLELDENFTFWSFKFILVNNFVELFAIFDSLEFVILLCRTYLRKVNGVHTIYIFLSY